MLAPEEPPLTLEDISERLHRLEDMAATERDLGDASRIVLYAAIAKLHRAGAMNVSDLIEDIQATFPILVDRKSVQLGLQAAIAEIKSAVAWHGAFSSTSTQDTK
ncbi:hypothetical protein DF039_34895 [Burkholderia cenocepacia]|nr:hypothetical protein DF039_34895 [Burkholderia cenocepacia]